MAIETLDLATLKPDEAVHLPPLCMTHEEFWELCNRHPEWKMERNFLGNVEFLSPTGGETGASNSRLIRYLDEWAEKDGTGVAFDSDTLFRLPNGADRAPDASWVSTERILPFLPTEIRKPLPLCPEFVVEILSPSDSLSKIKSKMQEYMANGAQLGWLIDRGNRTVSIYRPDQPFETLNHPIELSGELVLPGFMLRMRRIFEFL